MATNLIIDEKLLITAQEIGGHKTKRETVNAALEEYIGRRKQLEIIDHFGEFDFDPVYDYKHERNREVGESNVNSRT